MDVAWKIHNHKVNKSLDPTSSLRAGRDASKLSNTGLLGPGRLFGLSVNSTAPGQGDVHPQGQCGLIHVNHLSKKAVLSQR